MAFHILFLTFLGTVYAFSAWSALLRGTAASPGPFPDWSTSDFGFIYSMGILGAFCSPFGGYIYDNFGANACYLLGSGMISVGFGGIYLVAGSTLSPEAKHATVAGLYAFEELGSGTVYMGIALDTLLRFPAANVAVSMGLVAVGYSCSSILTSVLLLHIEATAGQFFSVVVGGVLILALIRVCVLGAPKPASLSMEESTPLTEDPAMVSRASYSVALTSAPFRNLALLAVLALSPCTALLGLVKHTGDAAGVDGAVLASFAMVANLLGRLAGGFGLDHFRRQVSSAQALLLLEMGFACSFAAMAVSSAAWAQAPRAIPAAVLSAIFCYGAHAPLAGVYIKDNFPEASSGMVLGVFCIGVAIANFVFNTLLLPRSFETMHGFVLTFGCAAAMCFSCLCMFAMDMVTRGKAAGATKTT